MERNEKKSAEREHGQNTDKPAEAMAIQTVRLNFEELPYLDDEWDFFGILHTSKMMSEQCDSGRL